MAILIDGYNLLYAAGLGRSRYGPGELEKARRALLNTLAHSLRAEAEHTTIVFDAADAPPDVPRQWRYKGMQVRFAAGHEDADALLEELIEQDSAPRRLTVVSSDHRLQQAARRRRAKAVDAEAFLEMLRPRRKSPSKRQAEEPSGKFFGSSSEAETAYWLERFEASPETEKARAEGPGPRGPGLHRGRGRRPERK